MEYSPSQPTDPGGSEPLSPPLQARCSASDAWLMRLRCVAQRPATALHITSYSGHHYVAVRDNSMQSAILSLR